MKGKVMSNSVEIKIMRTEARTPFGRFPFVLSALWSNYIFNAWVGISSIFQQPLQFRRRKSGRMPRKRSCDPRIKGHSGIVMLIWRIHVKNSKKSHLQMTFLTPCSFGPIHLTVKTLSSVFFHNLVLYSRSNQQQQQQQQQNDPTANKFGFGPKTAVAPPPPQ